MSMIRWAITLPIFAAVIVFILQNRMQVTISFWPFDLEATMPTSILSLGLLIAGFVLGSLVTGAGSLRSTLEARRLKADIEKLRQTLAQKEEQEKGPVICEPTILYKGRYQTIHVEDDRAAPRSLWRRLLRR